MKTRGIAVGVLAGVLATAVWWMMVFSPVRSDTSKVHDEVLKAQRERQSLQAQLAQLRDVQRRSEKYDAQLKKLVDAVPDSPALSTFIRSANQLAVDAGVEWVSVSPGNPVSGGGASTIALSIQVKGGVHQVIDYLTKLMSLQRLVVIDNLAITAGGANANAAAGSVPGAGASPQGGPTGDTFAGAGAPPGLQVQIGARMFTTAAPATAGTASAATSGTSSASAPASSARKTASNASASLAGNG